jgi:hypothetical protein
MLAILTALLCLWVSSAIAAQDSPTPHTGLLFATPEQLRGIPFAFTPFSGAELPREVDLAPKLPKPGQQGRQNSCVAWTLAYALKSFQEAQEERLPFTLAGGKPDLSRHFSPAFIYNQINGGRDGGSLFIDALNVLSQTGAVPLSVMPYNDRDHTTRPSAAQLASARKYRIDNWRQVNISDIKEVKAHLNASYPVAIGAMIDEGFLAQGPSGVWRSAKGKQLGGHAMLVVGYDDGRNAFKLINSWGAEWSAEGYGWIDYQWFPSVVREGYVAKDASNGDGPPVVVANDPPPVVTPSSDPRPIPAALPPAELRVDRVDHNQRSPAGNAFYVHGALRVRRGTVGNLQMVVNIYAAGQNGQKGVPIGSLAPAFATTQGFAATGTPLLPLDGSGLGDQTWYCFFPYEALNLTRGFQHGRNQPYTYHLVAEPVLYLNNFGVASGGLIAFTVSL